MRIVAAVVALAGLGTILQDAVAKGWSSSWSGSAVGTRLTWKVSGEGGGQKFTRNRTEVVTRVEADLVMVDERDEEEQSEQEYPLTLPMELEGPWKKTGDEDLKVGDRTFKCAVYESRKDDATLVQTTRVWKSPDSPHWAVKATFSHVFGGQELLGWTEELIRIDEGVTVAGKESKCRVLRKTTRSPGIESIETIWWADDLPGRTARKSLENRVGGVKASSKLSELVEVRKK